jgi:hypothetical protein
LHDSWRRKDTRLISRAASKFTLSATTALKKLAKAQIGEKDPAKAKRLTKAKAAKVRLINAKVAESTLACLAYDLFRKLLRDEPEIQWDRIMTDMHTKNPWENIKGVKHNSLCRKLQQSLTDCIEFHKLTVFTVDAAERLRYYLMCSVKKPVRWTICMHICRMEVLNKYLGFSLPSRTAPWLSPPWRWAMFHSRRLLMQVSSCHTSQLRGGTSTT